MHLSTYSLLLLLAFFPSPSSATTLHSISHLHSIAVKRSAGVARDLRRTLGYYIFAAQSSDPGKGKIYCVSKPPSVNGNGTAKTAAPPAPTAPSPYKLVQSYVSLWFVHRPSV
jgi:hypothetical protein